MTYAREDCLRRAEATAAHLRRYGYPEAEVAPEYCIAGEIAGGLYTYTICVAVGPYRPKPRRTWAHWWKGEKP